MLPVGSYAQRLVLWLGGLLVLMLILVGDGVSGQYEDVRCKCICPVPGQVLSNSSDQSNRKLYIGNVPPSQCNCDFVVLPNVKDDVQSKAKEFCPRCECKYESRNTSIIRFFVIFIIGAISFLVIYMIFLMILDPWIHKRSILMNYQHFNEEVSLEEQRSTSEASTSRRRSPPLVPLEDEEESVEGGVRGSVLNRVGQSQNRWKRQVKEQRRNIYDNHTMLN